MNPNAKARITYGYESREDVILKCREILQNTQRNVIVRDMILREMGIKVKNFMAQSTPLEIQRMRRFVSYAMNEICETDRTWRPTGSRHNPQWVRVQQVDQGKVPA